MLPNCLQSLKHLTAFAYDISDVYALAVDGLLPHVQSLCVRLCRVRTTSITKPLPDVASLCLPELHSVYLSLSQETDIKWEIVEALSSLPVMPRLRRCSLEYRMPNDTNLKQIFSSPLFDNDERHVRVRFILREYTGGFVLPDGDNRPIVLSGRYNEIYHEYVSTS